jgi:hypothetical protein
MPPTLPNQSKLSELTVTCNQCGSASMERLDAKEYRCNHCGAITVISDDDAGRLEKLLTSVLNKAAPQGNANGAAVKPKPKGNPWLAGGIVLVALLVYGGLVVVPRIMQPRHSYTSPAQSSFSAPKISPDAVSISPLHRDDSSSSLFHYLGMIYNHSGYAVDVPRYSMTFFPNGMKGGSTTSDVGLNRLLPGEYVPVSFSAWKSDMGARYEIERPTTIRQNTDEIARLELTQQQLVHHIGDGYQLVGIVQNTFTRPIDTVHVMVILYGENNEQIASEVRSLTSLRPGEKAAVNVALRLPKDDTPVTAYEYLVDASFSDRTR